ncbi:hypothetical protein [Streptomyces sp. G-G2]|uniref:zinc finger domain-containing protein n=1 Tax=Streptomyces sp. G-G2 TaxID=3046201 RepID=UPI0024BA9A73|nr:hypothetical protein [Streptomyces sp. G-G2]MDJ0386062.1 hypothetical protein [Streptomyces sp. G-G2]
MVLAVRGTRVETDPPVSATPGGERMSNMTVTESALEAVHETLRLFRHGAYGVSCPDCSAQPGALCRTRRTIHRGRRDAYRHQTRGLGGAGTLLPAAAV